MRGKLVTKQGRHTGWRKERQRRALVAQGARDIKNLGGRVGFGMGVDDPRQWGTARFAFRFGAAIAAYYRSLLPAERRIHELPEPGCGCARGIRNWRRYHARLQRTLPRKPILNPRKFLNSKSAMR